MVVKKTVLVTGFEPFDGAKINASWAAVEALDSARLPVRLERACLPCVFGRSREVLERLLDTLQPQLVICLGQADGRASISVERVAINIDDARIADNEGAQPIDVPIVASGPAAYWTRLPIKAIVASLRAEGLPAEVSQTAGTFVCNHVFYGLMRALDERSGVRGGFIHVPVLPEQSRGGALPSLGLAEQALGLEIAIRTAISVQEDLRISGGAVS